VASPEPPPPEPYPSPSPAAGGLQGALHDLNVPPPVWGAIVVLPAACFFAAALIVSNVASNIRDGPAPYGPLASVASEQAPTASPAVTLSAKPTGTPTGTATGTPTAAPSRSATPGGIPTMTPEPGWKPLELKLGKDVPAVPATADKLFTGVTIFSYADNFAYEIMGRGEGCRDMPNGRGILWRRSNGVPTWQDEESFLDYVTTPNNGFRIRADDAGLKAGKWAYYPCPK
jgi:hypothetical protein